MDIVSYRRAETAAIQRSTTWRRAQAHLPLTFQSVGFPIRVESTADLLQFTDSMQEGRFDGYMRELGGLSDADLEILIPALADYARFFCTTFHTAVCPLPLDTMLAFYALYTKLDALADPNGLLDIGPGCGYISFLLKHTGKFRPYVQIEACESFYMLQHLVNQWCFGLGHQEYAAVDLAVGGIPVPHQPTTIHVPWWRSNSLPDIGFDIAMCNAALTELSHDAFVEYANLIATTLRPNGVFIAQCNGGGSLSMISIVEYLATLGIRHVGYGGEPHRYLMENFVFSRNDLAEPMRARCDLVTNRIFTKAEIAALVSQALRGDVDRPDPSGFRLRTA